MRRRSSTPQVLLPKSTAVFHLTRKFILHPPSALLLAHFAGTNRVLAEGLPNLMCASENFEW